MFGEHEEISKQVAIASVRVGRLFPYSSGSAEEMNKNPAISGWTRRELNHVHLEHKRWCCRFPTSVQT